MSEDNIETEVNLKGTYAKYLRLHAEHEVLIAENDSLKKKLEIARNGLKEAHQEISSTTGTYSRIRAVDIIENTFGKIVI